MKTAIITLTVLIAFVTPSFAADPLHLLAQVNHLASQDAGSSLKDVAKSQKDKVQEPKAPQRPK